MSHIDIADDSFKVMFAVVSELEGVVSCGVTSDMSSQFPLIEILCV
jgi:hypothetical protein